MARRSYNKKSGGSSIRQPYPLPAFTPSLARPFRVSSMAPTIALTTKPGRTSNRLSSEQVAQLLSDLRRREAERKAATRLLPSNRFTDILGKVYAAPYTLAGSLAGLANVAAARLTGDKRARISARHNGIQFESGYFGDPRRAFTLGNAVLHGPGSRPDRPNDRYDDLPTKTNTSEHESGHTYQYQQPDFVSAYLLSALREKLTGARNRYEQEADDFAEWRHRCRGSRE